MKWIVVFVLGVLGAAGLTGPLPLARADDMLLPHPDAPWWLSGQVNVIGQGQPGFHSPYAGDNSLLPSDHAATSIVATAYAGYELTPTTAVFIAIESAGGGGLSNALGLAGFTNLDVVRNPTLGAAPYIGHAVIQQVIPLSDERTAADRDPLHPLRKLPVRRIEIRAGKLSTIDVFDINSIGSDSHLQFMNWAVDNNASYDYAADTRGYTLGATVEYIEPRGALRFGELLMPTVANGIDYDFDVVNARGENVELELHGDVAGHPAILRLLGFANHGNMGSYAAANAAVRSGQAAIPDVTAFRQEGRVKLGTGLNAEYEITQAVHAMLRLGWSDGRYESFAYTEVDNVIEVGGDIRGTSWGRPADKIGIAAVSNGLADDHRRYLSLGGKGFLLGDGRLSYGRESILESYYTASVYRGVSIATDLQLIARPGYNRDRGPVAVGSLRLHLDL